MKQRRCPSPAASFPASLFGIVSLLLTVVSGLVFAILTTSQSNHESLFQELSTIVRDQFNYAIYLLIQLTNVNFKLLRQQTLERIVFITDYMVQKGVMQSKDIFLCLLQQVSVIKTDEQSVILKNLTSSLGLH